EVLRGQRAAALVRERHGLARPGALVEPGRVIAVATQRGAERVELQRLTLGPWLAIVEEGLLAIVGALELGAVSRDRARVIVVEHEAARRHLRCRLDGRRERLLAEALYDLRVGGWRAGHEDQLADGGVARLPAADRIDRICEPAVHVRDLLRL